MGGDGGSVGIRRINVIVIIVGGEGVGCEVSVAGFN